MLWDLPGPLALVDVRVQVKAVASSECLCIYDPRAKVVTPCFNCVHPESTRRNFVVCTSDKNTGAGVRVET